MARALDCLIPETDRAMCSIRRQSRNQCPADDQDRSGTSITTMLQRLGLALVSTAVVASLRLRHLWRDLQKCRSAAVRAACTHELWVGLRSYMQRVKFHDGLRLRSLPTASASADTTVSGWSGLFCSFSPGLAI